MKKSKRKAQKFINYLFNNYGVPRIPISIHWHHPSVTTGKDRFGFGAFWFNTDGRKEIHIAGKIGTSWVLHTIAHEFVHYLQLLHGRDMKDDRAIEADADHFADILWGLWLDRQKDCSWLKAWERKEGE